MEYIFVGLGGIMGAITRYGLSIWVGRRWGHSFPLATFIINITGSFILGLLFALFATFGGAAPSHLKSLTTTGFLGAYTTYSTFSFEVVNLLEDGRKLTALLYFGASVVIGIAAAYAGISLGEYLY